MKNKKHLNEKAVAGKSMKKAVFVGFVALIVAGCTSHKVDLQPDAPARIAGKTSQFLELKQLPKPRGGIPVSVYSFRDQTGQYKASTTVSSFSTAVSQGATSMLVQALGNTEWFIPVEREGLQNILTERKIIRASQDKNTDKTQDLLPPLMTSSIILEGGIIGYESNVQTGGLGLGYFGYMTSSLFRQDDITVYLRAVDVRTGRVLLSVSTSKTVYSEEVKGGLFRYVSLTRLAEAEMGYSTNEPVQVCLLQAIQKAVADLVLEGIERGVWQVSDQSQLESELLQNYRKEKSGLIEAVKEKKLLQEQTEKVDFWDDEEW